MYDDVIDGDFSAVYFQAEGDGPCASTAQLPACTRLVCTNARALTRTSTFVF